MKKTLICNAANAAEDRSVESNARLHFSLPLNVIDERRILVYCCQLGFPPKDQSVAFWVGRSNFLNLKKSFNQTDRHFLKCSIMITQFLTSFWREWASLYLISPHCVPGQLYIKELILFQRFCSLICILITVTF